MYTPILTAFGEISAVVLSSQRETANRTALDHRGWIVQYRKLANQRYRPVIHSVEKVLICWSSESLGNGKESKYFIL